MRYEDTTHDAKHTITELFKVLLDQPSLDGTVLEKRIHETTSLSSQQRAVYGLKSNVTLNRNVNMYSDEQKEYIRTELKDFMYYFGYVDHPTDSSNRTPFFQYDHTEEDLQNYYGFKKQNEAVIKQLGEHREPKTIRIGPNCKTLIKQPDFSAYIVADRMTAV